LVYAFSVKNLRMVSDKMIACFILMKANYLVWSDLVNLMNYYLLF